MDFIGTIVGVIVGLVFGGTAIFLLTKTRVVHAVDKATAESVRERSVIEERLRSKDKELEKAQTDLNELKSECSEVRRELETTKKQLGAAQANIEQTNLRITERDDTIKERDNRINELNSQIDTLVKDKSDLETEIGKLNTTLEKERKQNDEKIELLEKAEARLKETFDSLSLQALDKNSQIFLGQAKDALDKIQTEAKGDINLRKQEIDNLIDPIKKSLQRFDTSTQEMRDKFSTDNATLIEKIAQLEKAKEELHDETEKLVKALTNKPNTWGNWGEMQLRRIVELAGMENYCDYVEQEGAENRRRPDMLVRLPNNRVIVVDAKAPLSAYIEGINSVKETDRLVCFKRLTANIKTHINDLTTRDYAAAVKESFDFVVMFIPGDNILSAALEADGELLSYAMQRKITLATPMTLISLLRAIAFGWHQQEVAENALSIGNLGKELYERLRVFTGHLANLGTKLDGAVETYNQAVGSFESRVLVQARRMNELDGSITGEIKNLEQIELTPRSLNAPEAMMDKNTEEE